MRRVDYLLLLLLAAMWGLSFVFYRIGAPALGPALFVALRVGISGAVLFAAVAFSPELRSGLGRIRDRWRAYFVLGAVNAAIPFTLIAIGELRIPASYASILNATAPLFSVVFGAVLLGRSILPRQALGIALGIVGVALLVGVAPFPVTLPVLLSVLASILAALAYGLAAIFVRERLSSETAVNLSVGQQFTATVWLVPFALAELPSAQFTAPAIESVLGIALVSTVLATVIYFRILQNAGATQALTVTYLTPVFGVAWGSLLLGESVGLGIVGGVGTILIAVALVTYQPRSSVPSAAPAQRPN
jgi:drug/metabolite transporter (DMT)-like permease